MTNRNPEQYFPNQPYETTEFQLLDDVVVAHQCDMDIWFPRPAPLVKLSHIVFGYEKWLKRLKYEVCTSGHVLFAREAD
jgi:hypothetical protein